MMVIVRLASVFLISSFPSLQFLPWKLVFIKSLFFPSVAILNIQINKNGLSFSEGLFGLRSWEATCHSRASSLSILFFLFNHHCKKCLLFQAMCQMKPYTSQATEKLHSYCISEYVCSVKFTVVYIFQYFRKFNANCKKSSCLGFLVIWIVFISIHVLISNSWRIKLIAKES